MTDNAGETVAVECKDLPMNKVPEKSGELAQINTIDRFLRDLSECPDLDESAADGGITVGMVYQHQARWMRTLLARATLSPAPEIEERARRVAEIVWYSEAAHVGFKFSEEPRETQDDYIALGRQIIAALTIQPASVEREETKNTAEMPEVAAIRYLNDLRGTCGASITILCDDEEAWTRDKQMAVEVCSDWTDWAPRRFYGESILQCAAKAVHSRDAIAAILAEASGTGGGSEG